MHAQESKQTNIKANNQPTILHTFPLFTLGDEDPNANAKVQYCDDDTEKSDNSNFLSESDFATSVHCSCNTRAPPAGVKILGREHLGLEVTFCSSLCTSKVKGLNTHYEGLQEGNMFHSILFL